jgi:2-keto-3-deoxy-L-rhamnonate aldolase RhmA
MSELKKRLKVKKQFGIFHLTASPIVSEVLATTNIDWIALDMEASPAERMELVHFLQSLQGKHPVPVARLKSHEHTHIEQVLDTGVQTIIVPKVHDAAICKKVIEASKYPPLGKRGVNPVRASRYFLDLPQYFHEANKSISVLVQIESEQAVRNIDEILGINGVDGVFVGCGDLALDMGYPGKVDAPKVRKAIQAIAVATLKYKKIAGIFSYDARLTALYKKMGYKFIAIGNDIKLLKNALDDELQNIKGNKP